MRLNLSHFPRSREGLETLAKYRGMQSYFKFAEAFKLERENSLIKLLT